MHAMMMGGNLLSKAAERGNTTHHETCTVDVREGFKKRGIKNYGNRKVPITLNNQMDE